MRISNVKISVILLTCAFTFLLFTFTLNCYALNLEKIKVSLLEGDYKGAVKEGERLIAKDQHSVELYYLLGLSYLKDENYLRAVDNFEVILKEFRNSKFKDEAKIGLGDTYFLRGDLDKATGIYQDLINTSPRTKFKALIYYRLSEIGLKKGDANQGIEYLSMAKNGFPLCPELKQNHETCPLEKENPAAYYSVQLGSFVNPDNAYNLNQKLSHLGYSSYVEEFIPASGPKTFRVGIGKLKSRQEAEDLSKKLNQEGYPTKICP